MITRLLIPLLLAQSGIQLPLAGYLRTADGWYELFGVRGNFLTGEKLPEDVQSAASFGDIHAWKTSTQLVAHSNGSADRQNAPQGSAWFAWNGETLFAWLPEAGELHRWNSGGWQIVGALAVESSTLGFAANAERIAILSPRGERHFRLDATLLQDMPQDIPTVATLDASGNRWTVSEAQLSCGAHTWTFTDRVEELSALGDGWVVIRHAGRRSIARCDAQDLTLLPTP